jgi:type II secretory pathway component PulF
MNFLRDALQWQTQVFAQLLEHIGPALVWAFIAICFVVFVVRIYFAISSRLRRNEIARCYLHLLEIGIRQGKSVEQTTVSLSEQRVSTMGLFLHLVAAHIENGLSLDKALDEVPRFLPAHVNEMIKAAAAIGQLEKALPLCRETLSEGLLGARTAVNKAVIVFCLFPIGTFCIFVLSTYVIPKLKDIAIEMIGYVPARSELLISWSSGIVIALLVVWSLFAFGWFMHGTALLHRIEPRFRGWADFLLPWRRKRLQRNFSSMLALALDTGIPEARAVSLAAQSTGNARFMAQADATLEALSQGVSLPKAMEALDETGEFAWRIRNVFHSPVKFMSALAGWHQALDARAAQQEEMVSQVISSSLILINGCAVGLLGASIFLLLNAIIEEAL